MEEVLDLFDMDYLIARHVRQQNIMLLRLRHCSLKYGRTIGKLVVVFDLEHLRMIPGMTALDYCRQVLLLDQAYCMNIKLDFELILSAFFLIWYL